MEVPDRFFADIINEFMSGLENDIAEKMENGQSATVILDELLERYQSEMLDRSGSLGLAFLRVLQQYSTI